jgi:hypothetical protein
VNHRTTPDFWDGYNALPREVRQLADKNYELLKNDPSHPSLELKKVGSLWSVRIGLHYRALATDEDDTANWFWIGSHAEYDHLLKNS